MAKSENSEWIHELSESQVRRVAALNEASRLLTPVIKTSISGPSITAKVNMGELIYLAEWILNEPTLEEIPENSITEQVCALCDQPHAYPVKGHGVDDLIEKLKDSIQKSQQQQSADQQAYCYAASTVSPEEKISTDTHICVEGCGHSSETSPVESTWKAMGYGSAEEMRIELERLAGDKGSGAYEISGKPGSDLWVFDDVSRLLIEKS